MIGRGVLRIFGVPDLDAFGGFVIRDDETLHTVVQLDGDVMVCIHDSLLAHPKELEHRLNRHLVHVGRLTQFQERAARWARRSGVAGWALIATASASGAASMVWELVLWPALVSLAAGGAGLAARATLRWAARRALRTAFGTG